MLSPSEDAMWCRIDATDVDVQLLLNDPQWGWVHHTDAGYHTLKGTRLQYRDGRLEPDLWQVPNLTAITIDLRGYRV